MPAPLDDPDLHDFVIDQFETDGMTDWLNDLRFSARATVKLW